MPREIINTPIGNLEILNYNDWIKDIQFTEAEITKNSYFQKSFDAYFKGGSKVIKCLHKQHGTDFQLKVWEELQKIPYGETRTYAEIAKAIGHPKSCRAVANACGQNKLAILVPCHRVVGKDNLGGYKWGIDKKKWLLNLEKQNKN